MSRESHESDAQGAGARVLVLAYHSISPAWRAPTSVEPERLERHLSWLRRRGYRGATLTDALTAPSGRPTAAVTFDDAHRSVFTHALPLLERFGFPGTVFVPTAYAGTGRPMAWAGYDRWLGTPHEPELACMDWDELRALRDAGWEIGSHTRSHPRLTTLPDAELDSELQGAREDCEAALGQACVSLAYPYSDVDGRVVQAARRAGYALAATVPRRAARPLPLLWPRLGVYHGDDVTDLRLRLWRRSHPLADRVVAAARRVGRH